MATPNKHQIDPLIVNKSFKHIVLRWLLEWLAPSHMKSKRDKIYRNPKQPLLTVVQLWHYTQQEVYNKAKAKLQYNKLT